MKIDDLLVKLEIIKGIKKVIVKGTISINNEEKESKEIIIIVMIIKREYKHSNDYMSNKKSIQ